MKTILNLAFASICLVSVGTLAEASTPEGKQKNPPALRFEELKEACLNPSKFHNQVPPTNIQVACKDVQQKWEPDTDGTISLPNSRRLMVSVISDKFSADTESGSVKAAPQVIACARYKEVSETLETVRASSCDEIIAFSGSALDFCAGVVNLLRSSNPQAVVSTETDRTLNLCHGDKGDHGSDYRSGDR